jgi:organic hydroperoxide reductase OsmC/OhrA
MHPYPHRYLSTASAAVEGEVELGSAGLAALASLPPVEFGGPGTLWSPETLLVAAVVDCFVLSFRAIARASKLPWTHLECSTEGVLDRIDGVTRFTEMHTKATLAVPAGTDEALARRLLEKAEKACLISNSLLASKHLESTVVQA